MRFHPIQGERFVALTTLPEALPAAGLLWLGATRHELELGAADLQATLQRWGIAPLIDRHVAELLNKQLPSHYDYTSGYDVMVFRRPVALTC